jgi:DNA (cytosine-5)-methyltransferase 1
MIKFEKSLGNTEYSESMSELLVPRKGGPAVIDLFAGCGGLALGFEAHGFETVGFEMDKDCLTTYRANLLGRCEEALLTKDSELPSASVIIGGPPCQPFSVGGKQAGLADSRNGFPAFVAAVERIRPDIFLIENVRGLLYRNKWYLASVAAELASLGYIVEQRLLNAVRFGVPQNRERLIIVGHKGRFRWPTAWSRTVTAGEALGEMAQWTGDASKYLTQSMDEYVARYEKASACKRPRDLWLDRPARTLTTRNLAGATGDMHRIRLEDGRRRRLTVREAARLQSFPDWFAFSGGESSRFKQVGNAVPPLLAYQLAASVQAYLSSEWRLPETDLVGTTVGQPSLL